MLCIFSNSATFPFAEEPSPLSHLLTSLKNSGKSFLKEEMWSLNGDGETF